MSYRFVDSFRAGPGWNCSSIMVITFTFVLYSRTRFETESWKEKSVNIKKFTELKPVGHETIFFYISKSKSDVNKNTYVV